MNMGMNVPPFNSNNNKHTQGQGHQGQGYHQHQHQHKKHHHQHHNHNNNNNKDNKNKVVDTKMMNKNVVDNDSDDLGDEPNITFGDIDQPPTPPVNEDKNDEQEDVVEDEDKKTTTTSVVDQQDDVKKTDKDVVDDDGNAEDNVEIKFNVDIEQDVPVEETQETLKTAESSSTTTTTSAPPTITRSLSMESKNIDWKRNVSVVEKTTSQMLLRDDGVNRYVKIHLLYLVVVHRHDVLLLLVDSYGKSQLCSMNTWNKSCPDVIKEMYLHLADIERPPMSETVRQKSPSNNNRQGNRNKNNNKNNNQSDVPHPDEKKIFNSEHLKSSALFGGGRPDKVVDTSSNEGIVSQANFILNVMTIETFDKMSDKFMKIGLETEELMKIGVDLIVSKAQLEEHFSFMYADLCKKITDQWVTTSGEEGALGTQFRLLLLKRCQEEFDQDRDLAVKAVLDLHLDKEDEDEKLLILKKRYTGHMRFVGEIYMKDMLKAKIMHYCINELLESKDDNGQPDNEKLACLCKLFQTIGKKLEEYETKKKRNTVQDYFNKISLLVNDKRLSSKVRFGFKDLIEMRQNKWIARRVEEKAKKLSEIRKDDQTSTTTTPRGNSFGGGNKFQDARRGSPALEQDEWSVVPKGKKGNKGSSNSLSSLATSSSSPRPDKNSNVNMFSALNNAKFGNSKTTVKKTVPGKVATSSTATTAKTSETPPPQEEVPSEIVLPGRDGQVDAILLNVLLLLLMSFIATTWSMRYVDNDCLFS